MPLSSIPDRAVNVAAVQRVLLVEDELLIRALVADFLRDEGFEVVEAVNGLEAIELLLAKAEIDLVLTDVRMPGPVDGLGVLQFVKRALPQTPVLVMSGHLDGSDALAAGADGFLTKPLSLDGTVAALRLALETRE